MHGALDVRLGATPDVSSVAASDDGVLLAVEAVGICGSDLHYYRDGGIGSATIASSGNGRFVPGHEFSARLVEDVAGLGARGDRVAVDPARPCGRCEWCARAQVNLCPSVHFTGAPPVGGAMTPLVRVAAAQCYRVPAAFSATTTMMLEPLGVALHAVKLADLARRVETKGALPPSHASPIESLAVLGVGTIGLLTLQLARLELGPTRTIMAVDPIAARRAAALRLGADLAFATVDELLEAQLKRDWKPHADGAENNTTRSGVDYVFEATNDAEGLNDAARACAIGASIVAIGIPDGGAYAPADAAELRRKAITTRWSRRMGDVMLEAIALVERGAIDVESLVTHRVALGEDVAHAFARAEAYEEGCIKTVVDITTS
tara:strand:- start:577 stop:1707 length:1131 start_codon:yes stop_codon:yes gene_type:complete